MFPSPEDLARQAWQERLFDCVDKGWALCPPGGGGQVRVAVHDAAGLAFALDFRRGGAAGEPDAVTAVSSAGKVLLATTLSCPPTEYLRATLRPDPRLHAHSVCLSDGSPTAANPAAAALPRRNDKDTVCEDLSQDQVYLRFL